MLDPQPQIDGLIDRLSGIARHLSGHTEAGPVSVTLAVPSLPFRGFPSGLDDHRDRPLYWARPSEGRLLLGLGDVAEVRTGGPERFAALASALAGWRQGWRHLDPDGVGHAPALFSGFAFDPEAQGPVPNAFLRLPLITARREGMTRALTFSWWPKEGEGDDPIAAWLEGARRLIAALSRPIEGAPCPNPLRRTLAEPEDRAWIARAGRAVADIRAGRLDKVVLTRRIGVEAPRRFEPARLMAVLAQRYPGCVQVALSTPGGVAAAATPERLARLEDGVVQSDALAGTLARDPEEARDAALGEELRHSAKNLHEHRLVRDDVVAALEPLCGHLSYPARPRLLRLRALQHLWTPIEGAARPKVTLLDLAARLHPTPAVGGVPRAAAQDWLRREGEDRIGLYTGAFGWLTPEGEGELSVVLRCALLSGARATLSAGAGIVADSDPEAEFAETELKLRAMLDALEEA